MLGLADAIPAQLRGPHAMIEGLSKRWPAIPAGGAAYVVVDDRLLALLQWHYPSAPGYALIAERH